jgi:hypothetical protein
MPSAVGWAFLRASIKEVASHASNWDAGLDKALTNLPPPSPCDKAITVLACDVASFWADETNQAGPPPRFGPPAKRIRDVIHDAEESHTIPPAQQYGADMFAFAPAAGINKMEVIVPTLPAGVEVWLNLGHGDLQAVRPGDSFDETFCRMSHPEGTHPLPSTGDVRMAMTTTTTHAPSEVTVKFVTGPSCESNGIMLYQQSVNGGATVAATFRSAACSRKATAGHGKQFQAVAKAGGYKLTVSIKHFAGYHNYPVDFESADPSFVVAGPGGPFSNVYWPGGTPPNHGGYITFSSNGAIMGLGFINAWNADFSDSILLAGTLTCNYSGH